MKLTLFCCLLVCSLGLANVRGQDATKPEEKKPMDTNQKEVAVLKTSDGEMVVEFWPEVAPKTVENFKKLARQGFYDGTAFHRIIKGFMIQGGDPNTKDPGERKPATAPAARAITSRRSSTIIRMSAAFSRWRAPPIPNSAGSQFFICLGTASSLDHQYTAFGKVIKGLDVLDKIGDTPVTRSASGEASKPPPRRAREREDRRRRTSVK